MIWGGGGGGIEESEGVVGEEFAPSPTRGNPDLVTREVNTWSYSDLQ